MRLKILRRFMMKTTGGSGFKKNEPKSINTAYYGTKANSFSRQILVSSGIRTLDELLSGGLPIGSLIFIEQDYPSNCYKTMLSQFLIDGLVYGHSVSAALLDDPSEIRLNHLKSDIDIHNRKIFIKSTPNISNESNLSNNTNTINTTSKNVNLSDHLDKSLKISWRYSFLKNISNDNSEIIPSCYQKEYLDINNVMLYDITEEDTADLILDMIHKSEITQKKPSLLSCDKNSKEIKRLVLEDILSPLWASLSRWKSDRLFHYLYALKSAIRRSTVACIVTFSSDNIDPNKFSPGVFYQTILNISDVYIKLSTSTSSNHSLQGSKYYKEYDGFLRFMKLYSMNCIGNYRIPSYEWAFKIKSNRFTIKEIHLPVEDDDDDDDGTHENSTKSTKDSLNQTSHINDSANRIYTSIQPSGTRKNRMGCSSNINSSSSKNNFDF